MTIGRWWKRCVSPMFWLSCTSNIYISRNDRHDSRLPLNIGSLILGNETNCCDTETVDAEYDDFISDVHVGVTLATIVLISIRIDSIDYVNGRSICSNSSTRSRSIRELIITSRWFLNYSTSLFKSSAWMINAGTVSELTRASRAVLWMHLIEFNASSRLTRALIRILSGSSSFFGVVRTNGQCTEVRLWKKNQKNRTSIKRKQTIQLERTKRCAFAAAQVKSAPAMYIYVCMSARPNGGQDVTRRVFDCLDWSCNLVEIEVDCIKIKRWIWRLVNSYN